MTSLPVTKFILCSLISFATLSACNDTDISPAYQPVFSADSLEKNTLILGLPSFAYNEAAEPLIKYLNAHTDSFRIKMKTCVTYDEYLNDLKQNKFDLTLINGIVALESENNGYSIVGKIVDDGDYTGAVITRKNSGITKVADLGGKTISLVPFRMIPGTMMPLYYLYQNGLDVNHDITRVNVSSFESVILNTYLSKSEAGVCLTRNWNVYIKNHPEILSKVEIKWETPPLINNALLVKNAIGAEKISTLMNIFFSMHNTGEGKAALDKLGIRGLEKATSDTYKTMLDFKIKYDSVIL